MKKFVKPVVSAALVLSLSLYVALPAFAVAWPSGSSYSLAKNGNSATGKTSYTGGGSAYVSVSVTYSLNGVGGTKTASATNNEGTGRVSVTPSVSSGAKRASAKSTHRLDHKDGRSETTSSFVG